MDPRRQLELAERLEHLAATHPRRYRARVALLALAGYGYVFGVLALVLALVGAVGWMLVHAKGALLAGKLLLPLGALAWLILRALWVRLERPAGRRVTAEETPVLHALVERVRARLDAPAVDVVLLTPELNASVAEVPRLGIFGWPRRYLTVGLPLAAALTPAQLEAVLAHEFAHLSRRHAQLSHRVWRLARVWTQLLDALQQRRGWAARIFERFFAWYAPYFELYTAVLSRQAELEADRLATEATTPRAAAETLVTVELASRFVDEAYWPAVYRAAHHDATPPTSVFSDLMRALRGVRTVDGASAWITEAMAAPTRPGASHPALRDRLASLGISPSSVSIGALSEAQTAANAVLGAHAAAFATELDLEWRKGVADAWRDRHRELQEARARRERLAERARAGSLAPEDAWLLARETLELDGEDPAIPLLEDIVARAPRHAAASFTLGRLMLARGDAGGLALLETAAEVDPQATLAACELADDFLMRTGRRDEALAWQERAHRYRQLLERAAREREGIAKRDAIAALSLEDDDLARLRGALAAAPEVRRARVARKVTTLLPERPFVLVAIERDAPWWKLRPTDADQRLLGTLLAQVGLSFDCDLWMVVLDGETKWLRKKLDEAGAGTVYERR